MKKFLPNFLTKKGFLSFLLVFIISLFLFGSFSPKVFADDPSASSSGNWVADNEVSFVGKTASRSGDFLDWTLKKYGWLCVKETGENQCDNSNNPLTSFWITIRNIVYALIALFVLATAFILIITRGQNVTVMRFVPRFVIIILLITFSFSLVQFIYQIVDIIQGFFLRVGDRYISTKDLLYIGFDYKNFIGYRLVGPQFDESAFVSLLLIRLTAITYYVMTGVLIIRKIILWFFIIISPVFPLLLFYKPIRNTAKIWVGEFFRWLLYAPLFAIFLHGLVVVWQSGLNLLPFDFSKAGDAGQIVYPTAINILLGGPGQAIGINNSVNLRDTFALYVVSLLMLWVVILLPFLLLKIFLDYLATLSFDNNVALKHVMNRGLSFLSGPKGTPGSPPPPGQFQGAGSARPLPFAAFRQAAAVPVQYQAHILESVRESADIMRAANLSIPRMRDIASYETSLLSKNAATRNNAEAFHHTLERIANPTLVSGIQEREKYTSVHQKLVAQQQKGNPIASSILNASQATTVSRAETSVVNRQEQLTHLSQMLKKVANPELAVSPSEREKLAKLKEDLGIKKQQGDSLAASILDTQEKMAEGGREDQKTQMENHLLDQLLDAEDKGNILAKSLLPEVPSSVIHESLPVVNRVQQVSLEDYEEVRKLWTENYQTIEPPKALSGEQVERREWIKNDMDKINQAIVLLSGVDPERVKQGMGMVSTILPFLLLGGFSKSEVISYLKAKLEAAKQVLENMAAKDVEEESMVARDKNTSQTKQTTAAEEKIPEENAALKDTEEADKKI